MSNLGQTSVASAVNGRPRGAVRRFMNTERRGIALVSLGAISLLWLALQPGSSPGGAEAVPMAAVIPPRLPKAAPASSGPGASVDPCKDLLNRLRQTRTSSSDDACEQGFETFLRDHGLCGVGEVKGTLIIATVADPIDSRLAGSFDAMLASLVLAMERRAALVDHWLPWATDRRAAKQSDMGLRVEYTTGLSGKLRTRPYESDCHERWPGVVLFEHLVAPALVEKRKSLLLVVGEVPTSGVQRTALRRAVLLAGRLQGRIGGGLASGAKNRPGRAPIRLVAPQFSGSASSIREVLSHISGGPRFQIISGSATARQNQTILNSNSSKFEATVIPDDVALAAFYRYAERKGIAQLDKCVLKNVALLVEADTVYAKKLVEPDLPAPAASLDRDCTTDGVVDYRRVVPLYRISFPIHIAEIRGALGRRTPSETSVAMVKLPQVAVPLDPRDSPGSTRDDIPSFSPETAAAEDRALRAALALLRENNVTLVGVFATDTRDKLFLADMIHRNAADTQLFMLEGDSLLTHPDYTDVLRGTLVVTTYPLFSANQFWSNRIPASSPQVRTQFSKSSAEGSYNALLAHLDQDEDQEPGNAGRDRNSLIEYRWPLLAGVSRDLLEGEGRPPLWITAVGGGAFWPIAALRYERIASSPPSPQVLPSASQQPISGPGFRLSAFAPTEESRPSATPPSSRPPDYVLEQKQGRTCRSEPTLQLPRTEVLKGLSVTYLVFCAFIFIYAVLAIFESLERRSG